MVSITLSVPAEVKQKMDSFPEMNWSGFVRQSITKKGRLAKQKAVIVLNTAEAISLLDL